MKILTSWLRSYLPALDVDDVRLAEDLTLRGIAVEGAFALADGAGSLFDMDITTNRVDAMNHYGIAREAAAIYDVALTPLDTALPAGTPGTPFRVTIEAEDLCGRFTARVVRGVTVSPSGGLVSQYFDALGQKPISNAVDATNFVLLGMGHPTHAFDLDKIVGGITVRRAKAGESIRLLDGSVRTLAADDLVVADDVKALGLAGVMGGWDSMITAETKNVLVEAAWFDPATVRASSRRHMIHTDASHRFERGADFDAAPVANALVTKAILAACGGSIEGELVDVVVQAFRKATADRPAIRLSIRQVQRLLGTTVAAEGITAELVRRYLAALGCVLTAVSAEEYEVKLPSWRLDLSREIDLIEEVARVYGYNGFANTLPTPSEVIPHKTARAEQLVRARLFELGYSEAISSTFASARESESFAAGTPAVALENPLNEEARNLRPTLLPGMVTMLGHNLNRDVTTVRLFEKGAVFTGSSAEVLERQSLAFGLTGAMKAQPPHNAEDVPFFELKGVVDSVLGVFVPGSVTYSASEVPGFYEAGRAAVVTLDAAPIASFGQLAASEASRRKLRQPVYVAELNLEQLLARPLKHVIATEISKFQAVERDFSFVFADGLLWKTIEAAIRGLGIAELQRLEVLEVFRDQQKYPGYYSTLVRAVFQSNERTLSEADLTGWWSAIIQVMEGLGGKIRG